MIAQLNGIKSSLTPGKDQIYIGGLEIQTIQEMTGTH
jgi:hypothetical protein